MGLRNAYHFHCLCIDGRNQILMCYSRNRAETDGSLCRGSQGGSEERRLELKAVGKTIGGPKSTIMRGGLCQTEACPATRRREPSGVARAQSQTPSVPLTTCLCQHYTTYDPALE
jgi:hypothetical protein